MGYVVAIDGPAGAGKSTVARELAYRLGWRYLDTGAMYRTLTLAALERGVDPGDEQALARLLERIRVRVDAAGRPTLDGRDVSEEIRSTPVTEAVSQVSAHPRVRGALTDLQRRVAREGHLVCEGRDMGTVVFPEAEVKVYLDADVPTRSARRAGDLRAAGAEPGISDLERQVAQRDRLDSERAEAPLRRTPEHVYLDTSLLDAEEVVERIQELVRDRIPELQGRPGGDAPGTAGRG